MAAGKHIRNRCFDCAIIGGGPGGLLSALYLKRFQRSIVLFQAGRPRADWIPKTHNLMGYYRGISGTSLLRQLGKQLQELKVKTVHETAKLSRKGKGFEIHAGGKKYFAKKVILATGIEDLQPEAECLEELRRSGLLRYCPICDAYEHRHQNICLLVRDDECARKALFLHHHTRHLTVIMPRNVSLSPVRKKQLKKLGVAVVKANVKDIVANKKKNGIYVCFEGHKPLPFDTAYVELGFRVRDEAWAHIHGLRRTKAGLLCTTVEQRLSVPGLFGVGDCVNSLAQISVAGGEAAVAATAAHNDLLDEE